MPDPLTAAELAALASITDASERINTHLTALKALAATAMSVVPSIPPVPLIRASLIGEPMQQQPMQQGIPPTPKALELARYQVPPGVEIKPDGG